MSHTEKMYFKKSISNNAVVNGSNFDDTIRPADPSDKEIEEFAASATRSIRARQSRSRPDMICLYQIGHFEHLLEKLGFIFYDNQQRRRDAHLAIAIYIRPRLDSGNLRNRACQLEKLHALVEQRAFDCSTVPAAEDLKNQAPTTHKTTSLEWTTSRKVGNAILIPDGISIAGEKASDVIAEKIVKGASFTPGLVMQTTFPADEEDASPGSRVDDHYIDTLSRQIQEQLEEAADAKLIVFEMKNENDEETEIKNWKAAYKAAKQVRKASGGKKSIMLVPSAEVFNRNFDNKKILQEMQDLLNQPDQKQANTLTERNPYAFLDE